jgi:hypothetical protein
MLAQREPALVANVVGQIEGSGWLDTSHGSLPRIAAVDALCHSHNVGGPDGN